MKIGIIGTAGRDKSINMTRALWDWMVADAKDKMEGNQHVHLISGGAAWADHIAVALFLQNIVEHLTLHLPAPFTGRFVGPQMSAGNAANYYHDRFSKVIGEDSLAQIAEAATKPNCHGTFEPAAIGYAAMFARNQKVATGCDALLAYTFGTGDNPADGGTRNTWDHCTGKRIHVSLPRQIEQEIVNQ